MALDVKLQVFEGPLELLLFLIEKNKVDIYDIPIALITDQYLEYLDRMKRQDMNTLSEFLVMAATLIDIKCKMLLPRSQEEGEEEEDPREELVQKLLEYKMYRYMAGELLDRHVDAQRNLYKKQTIPDEIKDYSPPIDVEELFSQVTLKQLREIFEAAMKRQEDKIDPIRAGFGKIEREEVSMEQKTGYIVGYLRTHKKMRFRELLEKQNSKVEVIVTFLVVLELMKVGAVSIKQEETFGEIEIEQCAGEEAWEEKLMEQMALAES
ncbi:MAG: segregation/condensation protein A [Lachnospiraceae bacterium]|nr:segregation/condensation protein A [Lachnospiraceae bacterium]